MVKTTKNAELKGELVSFLQQPQAKQYGYESQTGGIIDLLKKLHKKFKKELFDVQTAEQNQAHNFQLSKSNLEDEIKNTEDAIAKSTEEKANQGAISAAAAKELVDSTNDLKASQKYLKDMHTTFRLKS